MCVGVPMQVVEMRGATAVCAARSGMCEIDMCLVGNVDPGCWVMTFLGAAREIIDEATARRAADALQAVEMAARGEAGFEHLFADLIDREPQLPDFLRPPAEPKT